MTGPLQQAPDGCLCSKLIWGNQRRSVAGGLFTALAISSASMSRMFSGMGDPDQTPTPLQEPKCQAETMGRRQGGRRAISNLPMPHLEFPNFCHTVPVVVLVIPIVPGLAGSTVTGEPVASRSDSGSGEISLLTTGSLMPRAARRDCGQVD
jgi:hypothetical protein